LGPPLWMRVFGDAGAPAVSGRGRRHCFGLAVIAGDGLSLTPEGTGRPGAAVDDFARLGRVLSETAVDPGRPVSWRDVRGAQRHRPPDGFGNHVVWGVAR
jgi:hypothetical protein